MHLNMLKNKLQEICLEAVNKNTNALKFVALKIFNK